jgi:hypothetical protein
MSREAAGKLVHFEVHALHGERWSIDTALQDGELALERARQLLQLADVHGVKVWKEIHDPASGQTAGRIVLTQLKPQPKRPWRLRATPPQPAPTSPGEPRPDEPEPRPRRPVAPPPAAAAAGWPAAWLSVGAAGAALVALAVLTLLG